MTKLSENPIAATIFVGVFAALGFLALKAVLGGIETADYISAPAIGIGGAIGYRFGARRAEEKKRRSQ